MIKQYLKKRSCLNGLVSINAPCLTERQKEYAQIDISALPDFNWGDVAAASVNWDIVSEVREVRKLALDRIVADLVSVLSMNKMRASLKNNGRIITGISPNCGICARETNGKCDNGERGLRVRVRKSCNQHKSVKRIRISQLYFYSREDCEFTFWIKSGAYKWTTTVTVTKGKNDLFALANWPPFEVSEADDFGVFHDGSCEACKVSLYCYCGSNSIFKAFHVERWNGTFWNNGKSLETHGFSFCAELFCDYEKILCSLKNEPQTKYLLLYKMGEMLAERGQNSTRFNDFTIFGHDNLKVKATEYKKKYIEEYNQLIDSMSHVLKSQRDECITCKGGISVKSNV